jgi:hypothetical protein
MLFITFALSMACLHSCKDNTPEPTIVVPETSEQAQSCADALIEYIQPDRYAWCYSEMQGKLNLTVDYICKIQMYYSKGTATYYVEYVCYMIGDDVDWDKLSSNRI